MPDAPVERSDWGFELSGDLPPSSDGNKQCEYQKEAAYEPWNPLEQGVIHVEARLLQSLPNP
jgi:hypothetical protein